MYVVGGKEDDYVLNIKGKYSSDFFIIMSHKRFSKEKVERYSNMKGVCPVYFGIVL